MCGICGFVGQGTVADLKRMTEVMVHRGPDAEGVWSDESRGIYLGHRRLSIIDIEGGSQPMWTPDGNLGVVFNGEIYNHLELRDELIKKGHEFLTDHSDTEVLLHGYREWERRLPERLNGMWAFTICDCRKGEIFVSRDRFGQKPLFYAYHNGRIIYDGSSTFVTGKRNRSVQTPPPSHNDNGSLYVVPASLPALYVR